ncbi:mechanosensitive ion channel family protein [Paraferrimonas haliotis]|uniref:Small-conductance mechanosensitive channel n=1 Tax=Paraferrimonas haliotis TaxID=2013866 RepID=A0AA37TMW4_9GAMM|nr:mechanosensitive ion channel family protein [Paraferrimonas haliotis]GLS82410.1 mechanosensitive ion channel protein [Paraferrimonas haliotis]
MVRQSCFAALLITTLLFSVTTYAQTTDWNKLESNLTQQLQSMETLEGEPRDLAEFRLNRMAQSLRKAIDGEVTNKTAAKTVVPHVQFQLSYLEDYGKYLDQRMQELTNEYSEQASDAVLNKMLKRYHQKDQYYAMLQQSLAWANQLNIDTKAQTDELKRELAERLDYLVDFALFNREKLSRIQDKLALTPADQQGDLQASATAIKTQLVAIDTSLKQQISLMSGLQMDTTHYQQTMFNLTGDITQDVLNVSLASKLAKQWWDKASSQLFEEGPGLVFKLLIFVLIIALASLISRVVGKLVGRAVKTSKLNFSKLLQDFFVSLATKIVVVIGVLIGLSQLGLELGPLLAGFGIAGVIIGFALQDTLSNFASGMMILIYRPYDVGDLVITAGVTGVVSHMSLVSTTIKTLDNQRLIIPNNKIWGDTINNITAETHRRIDMVFGIGYGDDIEHAERVLIDIVENHPLVLKDPEPKVKLHTLNNSSVDFVVRPWVKPKDYWEVHWDITKAVKQRFDAEGISIPFPQRDVHIYHEKD